MRNTIRKFMLGTALVAGLLGTGAVAANAAPREFRGPEGHAYARGYDHGGYYGGYRGGYARPGIGVVVGGGPVYNEGYVDPGYVEPGYAAGYIPPSPGDGYIWLNGAWVFRGGYRSYGNYGRAYGGPVARYDRGRAFNGGFDHGFRGRR